MQYLRQSTAATVPVGPFLDPATGAAVTTLAAQAGRTIKGGTGAIFAPASWAHDGGGHYLVGLSIGHTDTIGRLRLTFDAVASYLPTWEQYTVLAPAVYDVLFGTVAPAVAIAAAVMSRLGEDGTVTDAAATTGSFAASLGFAVGANEYQGANLKFDPGSANPSVSRKITSHTGGINPIFSFAGTGTAQDRPFPNVPANGDQFLILGG